MKKFASLLRHKWTASITNTEEIWGKWAEDESYYSFKVPPQLVDSIVAMQNYVFDLNKEIEDRENNLVKLSKELAEYKLARGYKE